MHNSQETDTVFDGFQSEKHSLVRLPVSFFTELLPVIQTFSQLRLLLYLFWHHEQQDREVPFFMEANLTTDIELLRMTGGEDGLAVALAGLVELGALLKAAPTSHDQPYYFINGPQGQAALEAIHNGNWRESTGAKVAIQLTKEPPNIFKLYEKNIGAITPIMADILKEDEQQYPPDWIEEAIRIAVTRNVRNWKYVQAILERWQKEGRGDEQYRRDDSQDPQSYRESWLRDE